MPRTAFRILFAAALTLTVTPVCAQNVTSASMNGRITDDSGAGMPNATVTVTSPALQVASVTATSDAEGNYRVLDLPAPGVYKATFSMKGFQTSVHDSLNLSTGFAARVDAVMKVGQMEQTIEVVGSSPVIDTTNTVGATSLQAEEIAYVPRGGNMQELFPMATGVSMAGKPDVGDSNLAVNSNIITYGAFLQPVMNVEGINIATAHNLSTATYFSTYDIAEAEIKTNGNSADIPFPGFAMETVMKTGGNTFHSTLLADLENSSFQDSNLSQSLRDQKFSGTNPLYRYYDWSADLGGRIIRDKLWFYVGVSKQYSRGGQIGVVSGPNAAGCWTCGDAPIGAITTALPQRNMKFSYQPSTKARFIAAWQHADKFLSANNASATVPIPSSLYQRQPIDMWKGEVQWTPTPHLVIDALAGYGGYRVTYTDQPGTDLKGNPSSQELSTSLFTGPHTFNGQGTYRPQNRYEAKGSVSYITGKHQFKFGTELDFEEGDTKVLFEKASGNYLLQFQRGVPQQIVTYNWPITPVNKVDALALFAMDSWRLRKLTINYGVRFDRFHAYYPDQNKPAGQFGPAAKFPGADLLTWKDISPRIGAAYDVFGHGKTVVKGFFAIFGDTMGAAWANTFNPNATVASTYRWTGPCQTTGFNNVSFNNTSCDIPPATLASVIATSPLSATGGSNQLNNPALKQNKTYEITARVEQQIVPNVAVSLGYIRHRVTNLYQSLVAGSISTASGINILRPYEIYSVPVTLSDGLTQAPVTLYTYPAQYAPGTFNKLQIVNAPADRADVFNTFEAVVTRKYSKRWNAQYSFWMTKNHQWINAVRPSPNADPFPLDATLNWESRAFGAYSLPWGFRVSGFYRSQSGVNGQRTQSFSSPLLLQGSVTRRMEEYGAQRGPVVSITNFKLGKTFKVRERFNVEANAEVFNAFNSSAATSTSYLTGVTYQRVTSIVSPRIGRIGMSISF